MPAVMRLVVHIDLIHLFCTVLVARPEGFDVLALLIPCHASERSHFLNWVDGNHCCFLYRMFSVSLPGVSCLSYTQFPFLFTISASLSKQKFLNSGPPL